jgi:hypothetical protein
MARTFDFTGKSGQRYRYTLLEGQTIWPSGGNYIYVKTLKAGPKVIFCGETESLFRGYASRLDEAKSAHGATDVYLRLNITGAVRRAEMEDIIEEHRPPMNPLPEPAPRSASEEQGDSAIS